MGVPLTFKLIFKIVLSGSVLSFNNLPTLANPVSNEMLCVTWLGIWNPSELNTFDKELIS